MAITFKKDRVVFSDMADGEDAERLLEWLQKHPKGKIDLAACTHLHPANLQVLLASQRSIFAQPKDQLLADWIASVSQPV
ncbi:MAG: hypothetical protein JZU65_23575 [Chlorobium sp.]|jgi:hypothetical protein|nr:hypothetical protein [Chlorobium sp.]